MIQKQIKSLYTFTYIDFTYRYISLFLKQRETEIKVSEVLVFHII